MTGPKVPRQDGEVEETTGCTRGVHQQWCMDSYQGVSRDDKVPNTNKQKDIDNGKKGTQSI